MEHILTVNDKGKPIYNILFEEDFNKMPKVLEQLGFKGKKVCIVTDQTVGGYYLEQLQNSIMDSADTVESYIIRPGENYKTLDTVSGLYEHLINSKFDRKDVLIALGGGVVGDLTGYAAATYLRGIAFIQVPTTLLAMTDSSVGGKTGVDFQSYKNMIGAFHQPKAVYMNLSTLNTLNDRLFNSGLSEIVKYGLIREEDYYKWLKDNCNSIEEKNFSILAKMIYESCRLKKEVVEEDPTEQGVRATLNLGHTLGHAIEKLMNFKLLHGECVSLGIVAASYMSVKRGYITMEELNDITDFLKKFQLPVNLEKVKIEFTVDEIIAATKNDKKMNAGAIKFILLEQMGHAVIDNTVTDDEMKSAIDFITY